MPHRCDALINVSGKRVVRYARCPGIDSVRLRVMTVDQAVIVIGGSFLLLAAMIALMRRTNQAERRYMERRRQEWIDAGRIPGEEPNFYSGPGDSVPLNPLRQYSRDYPFGKT